MAVGAVFVLGATGADARPRGEITTAPGLEPSFSLAVHDYTVRCDDDPVDVSVRAEPGTTAKLSGRAGRSRSIDDTVDAGPSQAFSVSLRSRGKTARYHARCLPPDFLEWSFEGLRKLRHDFYALTLGPTVILFDRHGVPVWWYRPGGQAFDAKVLDSGRVAYGAPDALSASQGYLTSNGYLIQELDGEIHRVVGAPGHSIDNHDIQRLPNGNFVVLSYPARHHVNLTKYGGGPDDTVLDGMIEEIDPEGKVVWSWNSKDHVGLEETGRWWEEVLTRTQRDLVHINSVEPVGSKAFLVSLRHTDAVFKIKKRTGNVAWKLGGTTTSKSLDVVGDPRGDHPFGGQHDARLQGDRTITVYDNGTGLDRAPRAVRYRIDRKAGSATLVEQVEDPGAPSSFCCGSARREAGGWVVSWASNPLVSEFDPKGRRTFRLTFGDDAFTYRVVPAPDGALKIGDIRRGMSEIYGRPPQG